MEIYGFFFGDSNRDRKARDSWRPSVIAKNALSPINEYRTCFGCGGSGSRTFECCPCGTGRFERPAQPCFNCTGQKFNQPCRRCNGSGNFKPAILDACRKCIGSRQFSATCKKCNGASQFTGTCRKRKGSGWHMRCR